VVEEKSPSVGKDAEGSIMSTMIKRSNEDNSEEENDGDGDADDNDARVKETSYFVRREGTSIDEGTERPEERGWNHWPEVSFSEHCTAIYKVQVV